MSQSYHKLSRWTAEQPSWTSGLRHLKRDLYGSIKMVKLIEDASEIPSNKAVILDFYADWCGPCKMIAPKFAELEANFPSVTFLKINVDESEALAEQFNVRAMPTFVCLQKGKVVGRLEGANLTKIITMLEALEDS